MNQPRVVPQLLHTLQQVKSHQQRSSRRRAKVNKPLMLQVSLLVGCRGGCSRGVTEVQESSAGCRGAESGARRAGSSGWSSFKGRGQAVLQGAGAAADPSYSPTAEVAARLAAQYAPKSVTAQADKYVADSREVSDPEYVPHLADTSVPR